MASNPPSNAVDGLTSFDLPAIDWRRWARIGISLVVAHAIIGALLWQTLDSMVGAWSRSRTFVHGFLILPATWYMIWEYRDRWMVLPPIPDPWGPRYLVGLGGVWIIGELFALERLQQAAVLAVLPALILAFCGKRVLRELVWPLGLLAFAVPVGMSLEPILQRFTAESIAVGLSLFVVPFERDELLFHLSSRTWEVAPDCGGLRYLLPGLVLAYIFTGLVHRRASQRAQFICISIVGFVLGNSVRAIAIILGDHLGIAEGTDHRVFSYSVFGVLVLTLWWIGLRWQVGDCAGVRDYDALDVSAIPTTAQNP